MNAGQAHSTDNTQEERGDREKKIGNIGLDLEQTTCKYCCIYATTPRVHASKKAMYCRKSIGAKRQKMIEQVNREEETHTPSHSGVRTVGRRSR